MAVDGAKDLATALRHTAFNWVILGGFNVDQLEVPMTEEWPVLAWDEVFQYEHELRGAKASGRRIDYAVGNGALTPASVTQRWWHSDHALVTYMVDVRLPSGHASPAASTLRGGWMHGRGLLLRLRWLGGP